MCEDCSCLFCDGWLIMAYVDRRSGWRWEERGGKREGERKRVRLAECLHPAHPLPSSGGGRGLTGAPRHALNSHLPGSISAELIAARVRINTAWYLYRQKRPPCEDQTLKSACLVCFCRRVARPGWSYDTGFVPTAGWSGRLPTLDGLVTHGVFMLSGRRRAWPWCDRPGDEGAW